MHAMRDGMGLGDLRLCARGLRCSGGSTRRGKRPVGDVKLGEGSGFGRIELGNGCIECKCKRIVPLGHCSFGDGAAGCVLGIPICRDKLMIGLTYCTDSITYLLVQQ
jgi:hypothetical protein